MPKLPRSVMIAGFILLALILYFGVRMTLRAATASPESEPAATTESRDSTRPVVRTQVLTSQPHTMFAQLKGQTEANRTVTVRSETTGVVTNASAPEGQVVTRGKVLCGLAVEARAARVAEAEAAVTSSRLEFESAKSLEEKGWTTSNRAAALQAALDQAEAGLTAAKIEMAKTQIRAPFAGIFETRMAEAGAFLSPGAACGELVDLDPVIIAVEATESEIGTLNVGGETDVALSDGRAMTGTVRFVARTSNPETRTFRVEIEVPNPDYAIASGLTAEALIAVGEAEAILLSPAQLTLHDDGRVGVRYVDADNIIQFAEINIIDDAPDGIWVTGLPVNARLVVQGQDFLREGTLVTVQSVEG